MSEQKEKKFRKAGKIDLLVKHLVFGQDKMSYWFTKRGVREIMVMKFDHSRDC